MKNILLFGAACLMLAGCASQSQKVTHHRGWIGGTLATAEPRYHFFNPSQWHKVILGFPEPLKKQYKGGVLLTSVAPEGPLAKAGMQAGDLVLEIDQIPTPNQGEFRRIGDAALPGKKLNISFWRGGELRDSEVVVGSEQYQIERSISMSATLSSDVHFDILPDPNFSLIAVGFQKKQERVELGEAETAYLREVQKASPKDAAAPGSQSSEEWKVWLAIFGLEKHTKVLSQDVAEGATLSQKE
jgi:hypothetical protein